jgi:hypothetical protein
MDYYWASSQESNVLPFTTKPSPNNEGTVSHPLRTRGSGGSDDIMDDNILYRQQQQLNHDSHKDYGIFPYLAYVFYPPLYIAGPIINYNAFYYQVFKY